MIDVLTRRKGRTRNIKMSKYLHLQSYKYLKNIVKNSKFKNKYVKNFFKSKIKQTVKIFQKINKG